MTGPMPDSGPLGAVPPSAGPPHAGPPASPAAPAPAYRSLLDMLAAVGYVAVPVVNSVPGIDDASQEMPQPGLSPQQRERAMRRISRVAERRARERAKYPERYTVHFTDWVAIPWRDRPIEARLGDYAQVIARAITGAAAWRDPLLSDHQIRLDPAHEAASIAITAYRLYQVRRELGPPPSPSPVGDVLRAAYNEKYAAVASSFTALVRRTEAFDAYRTHIVELGPLVDALHRLQSLDGERFGRRLSDLLTAAAGDELATDTTQRLDSETVGMVQATRASLQLLGRDLDRLAPR